MCIKSSSTNSNSANSNREHCCSKRQDDFVKDSNLYCRDLVNKLVAQAHEASSVCKTTDYPMIDIRIWLQTKVRNIENITPAHEAVVDQIIEAATVCGSFHITGTGITDSLEEAMAIAVKTFFEKPITEKLVYKSPDQIGRTGYIPPKSQSADAVYGRGDDDEDTKHEKTKKNDSNGSGDARECYSVVSPLSDPVNINSPEEFEHTSFLEYVKKLQDVEHVVNQLLSRALAKVKNLPQLPLNIFNDAKGETGDCLRLSRYPACGSDGSALQTTAQDKLSAHCDWSTLTILYSNAPGLEEIRDGKWRKVPPLLPGELHINLGDLMHVWSNGYFPLNVHRVGRKAPIDRISYAYFSCQAVPSDTEQALEPICSDEEAPRFQPVSVGHHMMNYVRLYATNDTKM